MKIAHIVCVFPPYKGGMGNSAFEFARALARSGNEVTVFTPNYSDEKEIESIAGFDVVRLKPLFKIGNAAVVRGLIKKLKEFDIIHLHYPFYGTTELVLLAKLIYRKKIKLVVHFHMDTSASGIKGLIFNLNRIFIQPRLLEAADKISCASLDYLENSSLSKFYHRQPYKFHEILFGVDQERFIPDPSRKQNMDRKQILFVAGLDKAHYFKGLNILFDAVNIIIKNHKNKDIFELAVVGDGDLRHEYEQTSEDMGIADFVRFRGKLSDDELAEEYQKSSLFVLPSVNQSEAFGLVLLEAMASGLPVIASDLPGVRKVFEENIQGFFVKPGNSDELADKIALILNDDILASHLGKESRKLVEEKYDWPLVGARLDAIYEDLFTE